MQEESENERIERLEDEEFVRTGSFNFTETFEIKITQQNLEKDLIKKTEGKLIKPQKPNEN